MEAKLVAGDNMTVESEKGEYCGVVNIENLRTALLLGKFNGLEVAAVDFGNSYLHIFTNKNIYAVAGPEFGEWEVQVLIYVISIYGLKTPIFRWHASLSYNIELIGFCPSKAYLYLWM